MPLSKLQAALAAFAVLAAGAAWTLRGNVRLAIWILLAGLAFKSWIAYRKSQDDDKNL
jgi:hypothetical protein